MIDKELLEKIPPTVKEIKFSYNGGGDSGDFEFDEALDGMGVSVNLDDDLLDKLGDIASNLVEDRHGGWYNDEGGNGQVIFSLEDKRIYIHHNEYYSKSRAYNYELELE